MNISYTKIACRTLGTLGMGVIMYDAYRNSKSAARKAGVKAQQDFIQDVYSSARTIDDSSNYQNDIQNKVLDIRTQNPLPRLFGKIKGGIKGFINTLGYQLPLLTASTLALVAGTKYKLAQIGAFTSLGIVSYDILRQGFGLGKENTMD